MSSAVVKSGVDDVDDVDEVEDAKFVCVEGDVGADECEFIP